MEVMVYKMDGKEWRLDGETGWTMRDAKDALEDASGIPWFLQCLIVDTKEPQDGVVLASLAAPAEAPDAVRRATCTLIVKCPERFFSEKYGADMSRASLHLNMEGLCGEDAKALAEALRHNTSLETIGLGGNEIGNAGATALAEVMKKGDWDVWKRE